jgi:hypothetical protein
MIEARKTWKEKRIEKEEQGSGADRDSDGDSKERVVIFNMVFKLPDEFLLLDTGVA